MYLKLKMNSSSWPYLLVVLFILAVLHEAFAGPSDWLKKVFRARQSRAKRHHKKYEPEIGGQPRHPGFLMDKNFVEFLTPTLSNDEKLIQIFSKNDNDFFNVCRKRDQIRSRTVSPQWDTLDYLNDFGKAFFYSPTPRGDYQLQTKKFEFIQSPLTISEKNYYKEKYAANLCTYSPLPAIRPVTREKKSLLKSKNVKNVTYSYGAGGMHSCDYFELGIENIAPEDQQKENFNEAFKNGSIWATLYNVCYDKKSSITAFTKHTINSQYLLHRKLNPNVRAEHEKNFVRNDIDEFYDLDNQLYSFQLNELSLEFQQFHKEKNYLVRARLVPEYDMLYESWQYSIHNYVNYAPQWRSVNLGQWLKVEQDIRNMALKLKKALTVYTGVYYRKNPPKLLIKDDMNASTSTKKSDVKSLPIPSLFYKYVHSVNAGIVIITANGVSGSLDDIKCKDVCGIYGWLFNKLVYAHRNHNEMGKTKCCTPDDFFSQQDTKFLPEKEVVVTKILTFGGLEVDVGSPPPAQTQTDQGDSSAIDTRTIVMGAPAIGNPNWTNSFIIGG